MRIVRYCIFSLACFFISSNLYSIEIEKGSLEHRIVAGFNVGATMPYSIPDEVVAVKGWWPQFTPQLGYNITYNAHERWGLSAGVILNYKGMGIKDRVKYMHVRVVLSEGQEPLEGPFVGMNKTEVKAAYVTIPLHVTYRPFKNWCYKFGGFASYLFNGSFKGTVSDGYLRVGDPTGEKVIIDETSFNFDDDLRNFDFGITLGTERKITERIAAYLNMDMSLTPIFPSSFKLMEFNMYHLYFTLGVVVKV